MRKVSVRLPHDVVSALESAEANRSKLIRRATEQMIVDGDVAGVPPDLQQLAAREQAVDQGRLPRKRGTFRRRMLEFFEDKYESGAVTPSDAEDMGESWRNEAGLYGPEHLRFAEAVLEWFRDNWDSAPHTRTPWPDPCVFFAKAEDVDVEVRDRLRSTVKQAASRGADPRSIKDRLYSQYPETEVDLAIKEIKE